MYYNINIKSLLGVGWVTSISRELFGSVFVSTMLVTISEGGILLRIVLNQELKGATI